MRFSKGAAKRAGMLLLGAAIMSFGMYNIHARCDITEGGVLGLALLLHHWLGLSPGVISPVLDGLCYLAGLRYFGRRFFASAITASLSFAAFYGLWERTGPLLPDLSALPLAAALLCVAFVGVGVGLVVRAGGASGGDDVLALMLSSALRCPLSRVYFCSDAAVLLLSLSYIPARRILFSLVTVTVSSLLIDAIARRGGALNRAAR